MKNKELQILNILILTLVLVSGLCGQTTKKIFGNVYAYKSNLPLVGANILIDGTGIGSSTDGFGYFQFNNLINIIFHYLLYLLLIFYRLQLCL